MFRYNHFVVYHLRGKVAALGYFRRKSDANFAELSTRWLFVDVPPRKVNSGHPSFAYLNAANADDEQQLTHEQSCKQTQECCSSQRP